MSKSYKITIIGAGNVAWHMAQSLEESGHSIQEIYSRNHANAKKLCAKLYDAFPSEDLDFADSKSQLFIISVPDDIIEEIAGELIVPDNAVVVHTSGSKPMESLEMYFERIGVFYPLQTFSKSRKVYFEEIPICIEANEDKTKKILTEVARSITPYVYHLDSYKRKVLHIAAVFACNFSNHMLVLAKDILEQEDMDYGILNALISETINKALENDPKEMQTGPAIRKDVKTIKEHLNYLDEDPEKKEIYRLISENIIKESKK